MAAVLAETTCIIYILPQNLSCDLSRSSSLLWSKAWPRDVTTWRSTTITIYQEAIGTKLHRLWELTWIVCEILDARFEELSEFRWRPWRQLINELHNYNTAWLLLRSHSSPPLSTFLFALFQSIRYSFNYIHVLLRTMKFSAILAAIATSAAVVQATSIHGGRPVSARHSRLIQRETQKSSNATTTAGSGKGMINVKSDCGAIGATSKSDFNRASFSSSGLFAID